MRGERVCLDDFMCSARAFLPPLLHTTPIDVLRRQIDRPSPSLSLSSLPNQRVSLLELIL